MNIIDNFKTPETEWLSNMYPCRVIHMGMNFPSSEHAYAASKHADDPDYMMTIARARDGYEAKRLGAAVPAPADWDQRKLLVMVKVLRSKFTVNQFLARKLIATGQTMLIEGNTWGDTFWGVCDGKGENNLGLILMLLRDELRFPTKV